MKNVGLSNGKKRRTALFRKEAPFRTVEIMPDTRCKPNGRVHRSKSSHLLLMQWSTGPRNPRQNVDLPSPLCRLVAHLSGPGACLDATEPSRR